MPFPPEKRHCVSVLRDARLIEAYVPGLRARESGWLDEVQRQTERALPHAHHHVRVVAVPDDEMLLFIVWTELGEPPEPAELAAALIRLGDRLVVQRVVDAQLCLETAS
jgi:hypothetical protein